MPKKQAHYRRPNRHTHAHNHRHNHHHPRNHTHQRNYTKHVARSASVIFVMGILASFAGYFLRFFLARSLSPHEFGLVYSIFSLFGVLIIAKELGLRPALSKHLASFLVHKEYGKIKGAFLFVFLMQLLLSALIGVAVIFFASFLSEHYFHTETAKLPLIIYAIAFMIHPLHAMFKPVFQGFQFLSLYSLIDFVKITGVLLFSLVLIPFFGVSAPMLGYLLVYILAPACIYTPLLLKKLRRISGFFNARLEFTRPLCAKIFFFGLPLILGEVAGILMGYSDILVLTYFSLAQVGLYNVALPISKILWRITTTLAIVFFPLSSELWARRDTLRLRAALARMHKYSLLLVFPGVLLIFFFAETIITMLFGAAYLPAATALRWLVFGAIFYTIAQLNLTALLGIGHPFLVTKITTSLAVLDVIGNIILIPFLGMMGAVVTTVANFILLMLFSFAAIRKYVSLPVPWLLFARILLLNALYAASIFGLLKLFSLWQIHNMLIFFIVAVLSGLLYLCGLFLFRVVSREELSTVWRRARQ